MKKITLLLTGMLLYWCGVTAQYKLEAIAIENCNIGGGQGVLEASLTDGSGPYEVIWHNGQQNILNTNNPSATKGGLGGGNYNVTFINKFGCEKVLTGTITTNCNRRIDDFAQTIKVYPNPFTDALFVDFESDIEASALLQITDLTGKAVHEETLNMQKGDNQHQIITKQEIANGMYILSIKAPDQPAYTIKMIKE